MINFLVTQRGDFSIRSYLEWDGKAVSGRVRVITYERLVELDRLPPGTFVFGAVDQLSPAEAELAGLAADTAATHLAGTRVLNDPRRALRRYDLLRVAYERGLNDFRAFRLAELDLGAGHGNAGATTPLDSLRYPVFIRPEHRHTGSMTPLLRGAKELEQALAPLLVKGHRASELLVVEFRDTSDERGVFRKYSAFVLGDRILARTLDIGMDWVLKYGGRLLTRECADEEREYMLTNPHEAWLREVFAMARIQYGRIDYSMVGGQPRIWEINTNPTIGRVGPPRSRPPRFEEYYQMVRDVKERFYQLFAEAWEAVDVQATAAPASFAVPDSLRVRVAEERRRRRRAGAWRRAVGRLADSPRLGFVRRPIKRFVALLSPVVLRAQGRRS